MEKTLDDLISTNFGKYVTVSPDAHNYLCESFKKFTFEPKSFVTEAGRTERYYYLAAQGVQAIYLIDSKGDKQMLGFSFSGSMSGVYDSFLNEKPSSYFLEALTPSVLYGISKTQFDELFKRFPEFYSWRALVMEGVLFGRLSREVEMLTQTAKERFKTFVDRCPPELLAIPQKYLASYLNMKPETFSRLRAQRY